jgi:hypothetical protein
MTTDYSPAEHHVHYCNARYCYHYTKARKGTFPYRCYRLISAFSGHILPADTGARDGSSLRTLAFRSFLCKLANEFHRPQLEYFGKPLGLWSTSAKLLHTVSEMVFISMWSASLSLCFDNYFTSPLRCAPEHATFWWNRIERTAKIPTNEESIGDIICEDQVALIGVVFAGVVLYCCNLTISLFRIFEKVKYQADRSAA